MMMNRSLLAVAAGGLLFAAAPATSVAQEEAPAAGPQRIEMVVHGLSCPFCAYGLEKKLRRVEGLDSLAIYFREGQVVLLVREGSKATDQRLRQLVNDAGFEVAKIERRPREETPSEDVGEG